MFTSIQIELVCIIYNNTIINIESIKIWQK